LVTVKKFPNELETVIRDLWELKLRVLQRRREEEFGAGFSTTSGGDTTDTDTTGFRSTRSSRSGRKREGVGEKLPKLIEMVALCYLGILLMRLPTSLGEIYEWVTKDEMIFMRAVSELFSMRCRILDTLLDH